MIATLLGLVLVGLMVSWYLRKRGKRFVRAVAYLKFLHKGASVERANRMAKLILSAQSNADIDNEIIRYAIFMKDNHFNGKQLPAIAKAKEWGFSG